MCSDAKQLRTLVVWLEESKIRHVQFKAAGQVLSAANPQFHLNQAL